MAPKHKNLVRALPRRKNRGCSSMCAASRLAPRARRSAAEAAAAAALRRNVYKSNYSNKCLGNHRHD